jgi:hypothetical protein
VNADEIKRWEDHYWQVSAPADFARKIYKQCAEEDAELERTKAVDNGSEKA